MCQFGYKGLLTIRKKRYFQQLYKFEAKSSTYLIEVSLDDYDDIYDDWDPSPFKKRDIEDEFNDFIVNSSEDIPFGYAVAIILYLPSVKQDQGKEAALISAYRNYYNYAIARMRKTLAGLHKKILTYLLFAGIFLSFGYFFSRTGTGIFLTVLHEGIVIGGWVFLWEFFTNFFIKRKELLEEEKLYLRLLQAEIRFIYR